MRTLQIKARYTGPSALMSYNVTIPIVSMITPKTRLYCLLGGSVRYSASPAIHNASFSFLGVDAVYLAFSVRNVVKAVEGLKELGAGGCNVTNPFKEEVIKALDWVDERSSLLRAVNTVKLEDEAMGYNTDVDGVLHVLDLLDYEGEETLILGAGGAARSAILALSLKGCEKLTVMSRSRERAEKSLRLASSLGIEVKHDKWNPHILKRRQYGLIINATPLGTEGVGKPLEIPTGTRCKLFDMVYNPPETSLVKDAKKRGCKALGGVHMLVRQASRAEEIWLSLKPDEGVMMRAALKFLGVEVD